MSDFLHWNSDRIVRPINRPTNTEAYAPYVKVWFEDGNATNPFLTVGNESCPRCGEKNTAVIKSFEYGWSNGSTVKVEILDQEGGAFEKIAEHIFKDMKKASKSMVLNIEFGWILKGCGDDASMPLQSSPPNLKFMVTQVEVHFSKGAVHYTVLGNDLMQAIYVTRLRAVYGENGYIPLKEALKQMFDDGEPKIKFKRAKRQGKTMLWDDDAYDWKDAIGKWPTDGQNKLAVAMKWTENHRTKNDRGTTPYWDTGDKDPTIVFFEDPLPDWSGPTESMISQWSIGTFIVNGGNASNVIDFVPKINWDAGMAYALASGGEPGTTNSGKPIEKTNKRSGGELQTKETGLLTNVSPTSQVTDSSGFAEASKEQSKSQDANIKADAKNYPKALEAELRIQGDPSDKLCIFVKSISRFCSVIVINPFHLRSGTVSGNIDWLAKPTINNVLTNRAWQIQEVNHSIKEGSYITTLKLTLPAPGIDMGPDIPVGGDNKTNSNWTRK